MKEEYGVEKGEAEKLIGNFLQVIIDASDYLFSKTMLIHTHFLALLVPILDIIIL